MKKFLLTSFILIFYFTVFSQPWGGKLNGKLSPNSEADVKWDTKVVDLGKVKQFHTQKVKFIMRNIGGKPIIIKKADASCGCTKIKYPHKPIPPNGTAVIKVTYSAEDTGTFTKKVWITMNVEDSKQELLIKGEVVRR